MNRERLLTLADDLERKALPEDFTFDMSHVLVASEENGDPDLHKCGAAGCMVGFSALKYLGVEWQPRNYGGWWANSRGGHLIYQEVYDYFDLTPAQSMLLFYSYVHCEITPAQAARVVRRFVETGKADWSDVRAEVEDLPVNEARAYQEEDNALFLEDNEAALND